MTAADLRPEHVGAAQADVQAVYRTDAEGRNGAGWRN
jgi:hypothetical protein